MAKQHAPALGVDFDGPIHSYTSGWQGGQISDPPTEGVADALDQLSNDYRLFVYTSRTDLDAVKQWLENNDLSKHFVDVTNQKPVAAAYIDDRALHFQDWDQALDDLQDRLGPLSDNDNEAPPGQDEE